LGFILAILNQPEIPWIKATDDDFGQALEDVVSENLRMMSPSFFTKETGVHCA